MKKTLLLMSAAVLTSAASYAAAPKVSIKSAMENDRKTSIGITSGLQKQALSFKAPAKAEGETESMLFSYAKDDPILYKLNNATKGNMVYFAFQIPAEMAQAYKGASVTDLFIVTPSTTSHVNNCKKVKIFATEDLSVMPEFETKDLPTQGYTLAQLTFDNPLVISGDKDVTIGYGIYLPDTNTYYYAVDDIPTDEPSNLVAIETSLTAIPSFKDYSESDGSIYMGATLSGTNLPKNWAMLLDIETEPYYKTGENLSYQLYVTNRGANDISNIKIITTLEDGTVKENVVAIPEAISPSNCQYITVTDIPNNTEGLEMSITALATEANGVELDVKTEMEGEYNSYATGFDHNIVIEETTGAWCGWCPAGIVMMEYIKENFPNWIRIAAHYQDEMAVPTYQNMIKNYFSGWPSALTNRLLDTSVITRGDSNNVDGYGDYYKSVYEYLTYPSYATIDIETAECPEDNKTVNVTAKAKFSIAPTSQHLLSFAIVEDGLGPYQQNNYYPMTNYKMDGWQDKGVQDSDGYYWVETVYEDVARYLDGYPGIAGSLPSEITAGTEYTFERAVPIKLVSGDKFRVVAMVVNKETGEIVNARQVEVDKNTASVHGITDDAVEYSIENGQLIANGPVKVFTLDGRRVNGNNLSKGVYLINANGKTQKVLVK